MITGDETVFPGGNTTSEAEITDPLAQTLLLVDVNAQSVNWMQPTDLSADEFVAMLQNEDFTSNHLNLVVCAFADTHVSMFAAMFVDAELLRAITTKAGGETIANDEL